MKGKMRRIRLSNQRKFKDLNGTTPLTNALASARRTPPKAPAVVTSGNGQPQPQPAKPEVMESWKAQTLIASQSYQQGFRDGFNAGHSAGFRVGRDGRP